MNEQSRPPFPPPSNILDDILQKVESLVAQVHNLATRVQLLAENESDVAEAVGSLVGNVAREFDAFDTRLDVLEAKIDRILTVFYPPPPQPAASLVLTFTQGETMAAKKFGKFKLDVVDSGHLLGTSTVNDDAGLPTKWDGPAPLGYTSNNPAVTLAPSADGMTVDVTITQPPQLAQGIVISVSGVNARGATLAADNSADPINIVAGPSGALVFSAAVA